MEEKPTILHPIVIIGFFGGATLAKRAGSSKKSRNTLLLLPLLLPLLLVLLLVLLLPLLLVLLDSR